jgi:uncharacterized protein involved in exopolysaccharide biosynthesis
MSQKIDSKMIADQLNQRKTVNRQMIVKLEKKIEELTKRVEALEKPKRGRPIKEEA